MQRRRARQRQQRRPVLLWPPRARAARGALERVHPRLIRATTGAIVAPIRAGYLYHRSGDFMGIHTDPYGCELVLLTLLSGPVEPLHCHLDLADTPFAEIHSLAQASDGLPESGTPFEISSVPFLFSGQRIPHHRKPAERHDEAVVLVQFFGTLLAS